MKRVFVLFVAALALATVIGCGSAPAPAPAPVAAAPAPVLAPANSPEWLNDFPPEDVLWGIGTAKQSSPSMSMTTAEARARAAIARQLSNTVQGMFTDYNLDAGATGSQANTSLQEDVNRQITNINLNGARPIKRWQAPDGAWWYLVEYKKSDAKNAVANILNNEQASFAQFKAQQALQMLDAQLAKSEKPVVVEQ